MCQNKINEKREKVWQFFSGNEEFLKEYFPSLFSVF
jgi:hypothetical protein